MTWFISIACYTSSKPVLIHAFGSVLIITYTSAEVPVPFSLRFADWFYRSLPGWSLMDDHSDLHNTFPSVCNTVWEKSNTATLWQSANFISSGLVNAYFGHFCTRLQLLPIGLITQATSRPVITEWLLCSVCFRCQYLVISVQQMLKIIA